MKMYPEYQERNSKKRRLQFAAAIIGVIMGGLFYGLMPEDSKADPRGSSEPPVPGKIESAGVVSGHWGQRITGAFESEKGMD